MGGLGERGAGEKRPGGGSRQGAPAVPTGSASREGMRLAVTRRKGRERSPSQSNQRAERGRSKHHGENGHGRRARGYNSQHLPQVPGTQVRRFAAEGRTIRFSRRPQSVVVE